MAGFIIGWIANALSKSRYSFLINLFVGIFGAVLLNIIIKTLEIGDDRFFFTLFISVLGATGLLGMFHVSRAFERRR
jgi:uncharacterized membrane protein YeaQ/YmgE (transglycosylase-associated protein family)